MWGGCGCRVHAVICKHTEDLELRGTPADSQEEDGAHTPGSQGAVFCQGPAWARKRFSSRVGSKSPVLPGPQFWPWEAVHRSCLGCVMCPQQQKVNLWRPRSPLPSWRGRREEERDWLWIYWSVTLCCRKGLSLWGRLSQQEYGHGRESGRILFRNRIEQRIRCPSIAISVGSGRKGRLHMKPCPQGNAKLVSERRCRGWSEKIWAVEKVTVDASLVQKHRGGFEKGREEKSVG